ncbi:unnamed protein product [Lampetra fluviatilis]
MSNVSIRLGVDSDRQAKAPIYKIVDVTSIGGQWSPRGGGGGAFTSVPPHRFRSRGVVSQRERRTERGRRGGLTIQSRHGRRGPGFVSARSTAACCLLPAASCLLPPACCVGVERRGGGGGRRRPHPPTPGGVKYVFEDNKHHRSRQQQAAAAETSSPAVNGIVNLMSEFRRDSSVRSPGFTLSARSSDRPHRCDSVEGGRGATAMSARMKDAAPGGARRTTAAAGEFETPRDGCRL